MSGQQAGAPWSNAALLHFAQQHIGRFRIVDLKAALATLGASRGTSTLAKGGLVTRLTQELTVRVQAVTGSTARAATRERKTAGAHRRRERIQPLHADGGVVVYAASTALPQSHLRRDVAPT